MRRLIIGTLLALLALAPISYAGYTYYKQRQDARYLASVEFQSETQDSGLEVGSKLEVRACKVMDGFRFLLILEDGSRVEAHLTAATKDEAVPVVVDWLNNTTPPRPTVTLLRHVDGVWIASFHLTVNGKSENMVDLLKAKGLLL